MLIVSQDQKTSINFNNITEIVVDGKDITITDDIYKTYGEIIGTYESEERAKEVFQGIIQCYKDSNYEYESCWCLRNLVFEMPAK